jgi:hypothetical protein
VCAASCAVPWQEYFGEKIALYFEFMGHYTSWLRYPALVGAPIQIYMLLANDYNTAPQVGDFCCGCTTVMLVAGLVNVLCFVVWMQVLFSVFLVTWAVVMLEYWKRREKYKSMEWGMEDFEETEQDRPGQMERCMSCLCWHVRTDISAAFVLVVYVVCVGAEFKGQLVTSFISGKDMVYFPPRERSKKICISSTVIFMFIILVVGVVVSIYIMRAALSRSMGSIAQLIASGVNAVQIQVFNYYYQTLVDDLTEWENHRQANRHRL